MPTFRLVRCIYTVKPDTDTIREQKPMNDNDRRNKKSCVIAKIIEWNILFMMMRDTRNHICVYFSWATTTTSQQQTTTCIAWAWAHVCLRDNPLSAYPHSSTWANTADKPIDCLLSCGARIFTHNQPTPALIDVYGVCVFIFFYCKLFLFRLARQRPSSIWLPLSSACIYVPNPMGMFVISISSKRTGMASRRRLCRRCRRRRHVTG